MTKTKPIEAIIKAFLPILPDKSVIKDVKIGEKRVLNSALSGRLSIGFKPVTIAWTKNKLPSVKRPAINSVCPVHRKMAAIQCLAAKAIIINNNRVNP